MILTVKEKGSTRNENYLKVIKLFLFKIFVTFLIVLFNYFLNN